MTTQEWIFYSVGVIIFVVVHEIDFWDAVEDMT